MEMDGGQRVKRFGFVEISCEFGRTNDALAIGTLLSGTIGKRRTLNRWE